MAACLGLAAEVKVSPCLLPPSCPTCSCSCSCSCSQAVRVPAPTFTAARPRLPRFVHTLSCPCLACRAHCLLACRLGSVVQCKQPLPPAQQSILARSLLISTSGTLFWSTTKHPPLLSFFTQHSTSLHPTSPARVKGCPGQTKLLIGGGV